jgi:hypothetical protein
MGQSNQTQLEREAYEYLIGKDALIIVISIMLLILIKTQEGSTRWIKISDPYQGTVFQSRY